MAAAIIMQTAVYGDALYLGHFFKMRTTQTVAFLNLLYFFIVWGPAGFETKYVKKKKTEDNKVTITLLQQITKCFVIWATNPVS